MIYGVQCVCQLARPFLSDSDAVIRIRTDAIFEFDPEYLQSILTSPPTTYLSKRGDGFDWFAFTTFGVLRRTWEFTNLNEYNIAVSNSWNPEDVIKRRVPIPIQYIDPTKVLTYILRENGRRHYYP